MRRREAAGRRGVNEYPAEVPGSGGYGGEQGGSLRAHGKAVGSVFNVNAGMKTSPGILQHRCHSEIRVRTVTELQQLIRPAFQFIQIQQSQKVLSMKGSDLSLSLAFRSLSEITSEKALWTFRPILGWSLSMAAT